MEQYIKTLNETLDLIYQENPQERPSLSAPVVARYYGTTDVKQPLKGPQHNPEVAAWK